MQQDGTVCGVSNALVMLFSCRLVGAPARAVMQPQGSLAFVSFVLHL
jgi:hypothetical protein